MSIPQLYGGAAATVQVFSGLTVFVGPNGTGKTQLLRACAAQASIFLHEAASLNGIPPKKVRYISTGRMAPFERFRAAIDSPHGRLHDVAAVGHYSYRTNWEHLESSIGDYFELERRADLRLKIEARLQQLFSRSLRLEWQQNGLNVSFASTSGGGDYGANHEASGILHLVGLLASIYNDEIGVLLIDEPEISLHPQYQAFLLQELERASGDPRVEKNKKLVLIATHSPSLLPLRSTNEIHRIVFFSDSARLPKQISPDADILIGRKIPALIARLGMTHRLAFFAGSALLVEGPSDEIIASQLARAIDHPLLAANAQIVPVTGKGEFPQVAKLFSAMGKKVVILADLDALSDSNQLVNYFSVQEGASEIANRSGHASFIIADQQLRSDFHALVKNNWPEILPIIELHRYWSEAKKEDQEQAKIRATLAVLLSSENAFSEISVAVDLERLRLRFLALLNNLEKVGCFFLRKGTIEDYYEAIDIPDAKPEAAATEATQFADFSTEQLTQRYADILRPIWHVAPVQKVDEDALLRTKLAAGIASAFQFARPDTTAIQFKTNLTSTIKADAELFEFQSIPNAEPVRLVVAMRSPIFERPSFPFEISFDENLNQIVKKRLPGNQ
jgi:hypothetical protein